jgi:predicted house-cleaning noncanonical NTP pyrophosphatase (MazG superfamily)
MNTKAIESAAELNEGDQLVLTTNSFLEANLDLFTEKELDDLANLVEMGEIVTVIGFSKYNTALIMLKDKTLFEINPTIFEKVIETPQLNILAHNIFKDFAKDQSMDAYNNFLNELNAHGLTIITL